MQIPNCLLIFCLTPKECSRRHDNKTYAAVYGTIKASGDWRLKIGPLLIARYSVSIFESGQLALMKNIIQISPWVYPVVPNIAHTVPRNELQWFEMNGMGKYAIQKVKRQYNSRHSESVDSSGRFTPSVLTNNILPSCRKPRTGKIHRNGWYICDANHTIWASTTTFHYNPSPFLHSFCLHASPCPSFHFWQDFLCSPKARKLFNWWVLQTLNKKKWGVSHAIMVSL